MRLSDVLSASEPVTGAACLVTETIDKNGSLSLGTAVLNFHRLNP